MYATATEESVGISATKLKRFMTNPSAMKKDPDYPIYQTGLEQGRADMRREILTFLEKEYMGEDAPERGTPKAAAILELAHKASQHMREIQFLD